MADKLERETAPKETGKETEPVSKEQEPTLEKVYKEEEFRKAQAAWDKQITLAKSESEKAKAEAEQFKAELEYHKAEIAELRGIVDKLDDPDEKAKIFSRLEDAKRKAEVAKEKAEAARMFEEAEKLAWSVRMAQKATELSREYGIDIKDLEECMTEEEMEVKALKYQLGKSKEPEKPPKFASGGSDGGGVNLNDLSPRELIRRGVAQKKIK